MTRSDEIEQALRQFIEHTTAPKAKSLTAALFDALALPPDQEKPCVSCAELQMTVARMDDRNQRQYRTIEGLEKREKKYLDAIAALTKELAALKAPAEPKAETPAKPAITKVGRIWRGPDDKPMWNGWEFNGKPEPNGVYADKPFSLWGWTFDELARECVLKNPREGDRFDHFGEERIVKMCDQTPTAFSTHSGAQCDRMVEYESYSSENNTNFRPIADAAVIVPVVENASVPSPLRIKIQFSTDGTGWRKVHPLVVENTGEMLDEPTPYRAVFHQCLQTHEPLAWTPPR